MECHVTAQAGQFALDIALSTAAEPNWLGIIGQSGAGKSTFLQALAGFNAAANVTGRWHSKDLNKLENAVLVSAQTPLFPALSVAGNLELVACHNQQLDNVNTIVALCECTALMSRQTNELSGGELQRVKLARALLANPALLLLDESFSAMDRALRFGILYKLKAYLGQHVKVIMVSHDINDIIVSCDHLSIIESGRCVACGPLSEMLNPARGHKTNASLPLISVLHGEIEERNKGISRISIGGRSVKVVDESDIPMGQSVRLLLPASEVTLATENSTALHTNCLQGSVQSVVPYSATQSAVKIACEGQELAALLDNYDSRVSELKKGQLVWAYFSGEQTLA
ncbi:MAG: ATP-binding cassette domain-containing protein [Pseudomonadota bacterium]|nr:ATP-binding cassette domain-containing protein [Pseudomonadota bacterium]RPH14981.1 MAG: ATP-binding cassette domain-containing protein [Alteromonadaceae bacterium TMED7]|tara:strand:+ start:2938 stop:3963 length:1026 start_codon:yes stop_codon:yes gene_type:complete